MKNDYSEKTVNIVFDFGDASFILALCGSDVLGPDLSFKLNTAKPNHLNQIRVAFTQTELNCLFSALMKKSISCGIKEPDQELARLLARRFFQYIKLLPSKAQLC